MKLIVLFAIVTITQASSNLRKLNSQYPDDEIKKDISEICNKLPHLTGCSFSRSCVLAENNSNKCAPLSILGDICKDDEAKESCKKYHNTCDENSALCQIYSPLHNIPQASKVMTNVRSKICTGMPMPGCSKCNENKCDDPLKTMANLCSEMDMDGCDTAYEFCKGLIDLDGILDEVILRHYQCDVPVTPPVMRMYFHSGIKDYILFENLVPETMGAYVLCCIVIALLGMFTTFLRGYKMNREIHWRETPIFFKEKADKEIASGSTLTEALLNTATQGPTTGSSNDSILRRNMERALFNGLIICIDYSLMLIAMSFNVGLFLSVIVGFMLGQIFFGHIGHRDLFQGQINQDWHTAIIRITGMTCDSCVSTIQRAVLALTVVKVDVNRPEEQATVIFDSLQTNSHDIVNAIEAVGFSATVISEIRQPLDPFIGSGIEVASSCCAE